MLTGPLLALIAFTQPVATRSDVVKRWPATEGGNGHYYRVYVRKTGLAWDEADRIARQSGGYLATLTTRTENDFVLKLTGQVKDSWKDWAGVTLGPWIGARKDAAGKTPSEGWRWVTGEPFKEVFWALGNEPEAGGDKRMQLFPTGWDDVAADFSNIASCVIEYDKRPTGVFPAEAVVKPEHPAAKVALSYFEALKKGDGKEAAGKIWSMDGLLKRVFGNELRTMARGTREQMKRGLTAHMERMLGFPEVQGTTQRAEVSAFVVVPREESPEKGVRVEFTATEDHIVVKNWLVMERVAGKWRIVDQGHEDLDSMAAELGKLYRASGLKAEKWLERLGEESKKK